MDKNMPFIDRKEENISGNVPVQITPKKKKKNKKQNNPSTPSSGSGSSSSSEPPKTPGRERSELNIEVKGYKESSLTPKSKITSDKVRTVFRSSGGSASESKESSPAVSSPLPTADDEDNVFSSDATHRTPTEVVDGGVWYLHRKTSESHYISQQYNVDATTASPSKSVTAIPHVTFKSRKAVSIGSNRSSTSSTDGDLHQTQSPCQHASVEHSEKSLAGAENPSYTNSPPSASSATNQFIFDTLEDDTKGSTLSDGKLDSDREDVQQLIQSSYMVSDISDVIDRDNMKATDSKKSKKPSSPSAESSVDALDRSKTKAKGSSSNNNVSNLTLDPKTHHESSASRVAYSPGLAIRSYALEELEEKKSSQKSPSPDAKSMRYDANSSKIDIDAGTPVDNVVVPPTKSSKSATENSSSPFKIMRVNKVHLPDHTPVSSSEPTDSGMTEEERRESEDRLDSLVDIHAIQAGYRFHDVGMMMMDTGGICNPAFDDETDYELSSSPQLYSSSENTSSTKPGEVQNEIVVPVLSSSTSSALSLSPSLMKSPAKQTPNIERTTKDKKVTQQQITLPTGSENTNIIGDVGFLLKATSEPQTQSQPQQPTKTKKKAKKPAEPVQFTRKFNPTKKFESTLKSMGATLVSESLIVDVYYDTDSFDLTLNDSWLRSRNGKWQFHSGFTSLFGNGHSVISGSSSNADSYNNDSSNKNDSGVKGKNKTDKKNKNKRNKNKNNNNNNSSSRNDNDNKNKATASSSPSSSPTSSYQEFEDVDSLIFNLHASMGNVLPKDFLKRGQFLSVAAFAHRAGLREYVRYTSVHKSYSLDDGMTVWLDMPQHGYWSGSVTTTAPSKESMHRGVKALDDFWNKTGVKPLSMMVTCA